MKNYYLSLLFFLFLTVACEKKEELTSLEVSPTTVEYAINGGPATVQIKSDGGWSISDIPNWVTLSEVSGSGNKDITATARVNDTGVMRRDSFLVRTADNSHTAIVKVSQSAGSAYNDYGLEVEDAREIVLNGSTLSMDSIHIKSNVQWVLEGPDWIEGSWNGIGSWGGRGIKADGKTQISGSGTLSIIAQQNQSEDDRSDKIVIRSVADGKTIEMPITQLGAYNVRPVNMILLANSFGWFWRHGYAIKYIYWKSFAGSATSSEKSESSMTNYTLIEPSPTTLSSLKTTKPNSSYEICAMGIDASGRNGQVSSFNVRTPSDQNQPLAQLGEPTHDTSGWHSTVTMNNYAKGYYTYSSRNSSTISATDAFVAYVMQQNMKRNPDNYPLRTNNVRWSLDINTDVVMVTWAVDATGVFSNLISRRNCQNTASARQNIEANEVTQLVEDIDSEATSRFYMETR